MVLCPSPHTVSRVIIYNYIRSCSSVLKILQWDLKSAWLLLQWLKVELLTLPEDFLFNCFILATCGYMDVLILRLPWENPASGEHGILRSSMNSCKMSLESQAETLPPERLPKTSFPLLYWRWAPVPSSKSFSKRQYKVPK